MSQARGCPLRHLAVAPSGLQQPACCTWVPRLYPRMDRHLYLCCVHCLGRFEGPVKAHLPAGVWLYLYFVGVQGATSWSCTPLFLWLVRSSVVAFLCKLWSSPLVPWQSPRSTCYHLSPVQEAGPSIACVPVSEALHVLCVCMCPWCPVVWAVNSC